MTIDRIADKANSELVWDKIWGEEGHETWRKSALVRVYQRIAQCTPYKAATLTDVGGGVGSFAEVFSEVLPKVSICVVDHSEIALKHAMDTGCVDITHKADLRSEVDSIPVSDVFVSTEFIEHLGKRARARLLSFIADNSNYAFISVPNNRLGPDEERQHTRKWTAKQFLDYLKEYWECVRVEVIGGYLLGICGDIARKKYKMSVTLPVRDEELDLANTLATYRGIADEFVVGVDPRSKDRTFEIAKQYADKVFYLDRPSGPPEEDLGGDKIHFSWCRNQCIEQCSGEWIFMTEGHEYLVEGMDVLLNLDTIIPSNCSVGFVFRQGNGQRWAFPWLFRNRPDIRFRRPVHNELIWPEKALCVQLPLVKTLHQRSQQRAETRAVQRRAQNRKQLMDDWRTGESVQSLFYLGQEWRELNPQKAIERLEQFLGVSNNGVQKYQARLMLAKERMRRGERKEAYECLMGCTKDDWCRTEHWVWLGDMAMLSKEYEKAYRFYVYATTTMGDPPFTVWWIDLSYYGHIPAQRLAMVCGELGKLEESLFWAQKVIELFPEGTPPEAFREAERNMAIIKEAIDATTQR